MPIVDGNLKITTHSEIARVQVIKLYTKKKIFPFVSWRRNEKNMSVFICRDFSVSVLKVCFVDIPFKAGLTDVISERERK